MSTVEIVSVEKLQTTLCRLRGNRTDPRCDLAPTPIRVASCDDGTFEVIDGFKRLSRWKDEGARELPVVVEHAESSVSRKARLLAANAPLKTASAMDEARVVASLVDDDALSEQAIGKLLGHKKSWVSRRLLLARRLAAELSFRLDAGSLCLSVALDLCSFDRKTQNRLGEAVLRHKLSTREARAFLETYRLAPDPGTHEELLRDPRSALPSEREQGASPLGATAKAIEERLHTLEASLQEIKGLDLSGFSETERRVLDAQRRRVAATVVSTATVLKEMLYEPRREETHRGSRSPGDDDPGHCQEARPKRQDDPKSPQSAAGPAGGAEAREVQGACARTCGKGAFRAPDPPRVAGPRLYGLPDHTAGLSAGQARPPQEKPYGLPALRDGPGI